MKPASTSKLKNGDRKNLEAMVLWPFLDFAEKGEQELFAYMRHVGIQVDALDRDDKRSAQDLILSHYRLPDGTYDVELAARDLLRWPAIAARVHELRNDQAFLSELNDVVSEGTSQKISAKTARAPRRAH
ncbi:hypothetical protein [Hyphomicrobium sp. 2TAF46]|uniref:hypothetical protein n=1 Tax=Hyphomicrobium sp. 2TAF46 TaxID=3233019 RepID=UPI003F8EC748